MVPPEPRSVFDKHFWHVLGCVLSPECNIPPTTKRRRRMSYVGFANSVRSQQLSYFSRSISPRKTFNTSARACSRSAVCPAIIALLCADSGVASRGQSLPCAVSDPKAGQTLARQTWNQRERRPLNEKPAAFCPHSPPSSKYLLQPAKSFREFVKNLK